ncbi:MAG: HAMP domain-containing sensor histidine kinase [Candidatus Sedimenticola sp. (ex Thyasira tokunagai)]
MAHELNNPLGGMLQGIQNIQRRLSPDLEKNRVVAQELGLDLEKICSYLDQREIEKFMQGIRESGERAAEIVQNMLQFARKAESGLRPERLDLLVDRALELAAVDYDLKKKYDFREIEIIRQYDTTLAPVRCIASEIQQVLLNLLRNAAQALYKGEGKTEHPRITVRTYSQKGMACIKVEDNGPGMDEETRNHVFDPFFTTRPVGEGTGLGLSVSYFIVTQEHNGRMSVDSQPGLGAAFMVCLPMTS